MESNLVMVCVSSLIGVFIVLIFLALVMQGITYFFPEKKKIVAASDDAAIFAGITSTYARIFPGTRVSSIEELKTVK